MKKILVIEDDAFIAEEMQYFLRANGFHVLAAHDGLQGYELAQKEKPDLITLDLTLPSLSGYSICGFLKTNPKYSHVPIIVISGRYEPVDQIFDESAKPDCYMVKPISLSILLEKIHHFLRP